MQNSFGSERAASEGGGDAGGDQQRGGPRLLFLSYDAGQALAGGSREGVGVVLGGGGAVSGRRGGKEAGGRRGSGRRRRHAIEHIVLIVPLQAQSVL